MMSVAFVNNDNRQAGSTNSTKDFISADISNYGGQGGFHWCIWDISCSKDHGLHSEILPISNLYDMK
jgi:hypothetical protein